MRYIDWQFFFHAWELKGKFPAILEQPAARELYDDAHGAARRASFASSALQARGVYGFWPAHAGTATTSCSRTARASTSCASRPTTATPARTARSPTTSPGPADHLGAFAVSIHGADELAARYEAEHDDYRAIMVKALADRLAEAFAEYLHEPARREWYEPATSRRTRT